MSNWQVDRFNHIVGNYPKGDYEGVDSFWKQVELQAKLILEEAKEQYEAAKNRDIVEVLDGFLDVKYLQEYMDTLLKEVGIQTVDGFLAVCDNNDQKFTTSADLAERSKDHQVNVNGVASSVHIAKYDGEVYYVVKRDEDGKVLKLLHHEAPDLAQYIPHNVLEFLENK